MRFSLASFVAAAALVSQASAEIFITSPVATTTCTGGQPCKISWNDDGKAPVLAQIGACTVGLYVGNQQQQTKLQDIQSVDVSAVSEISFTPDAAVGENSNQYFIRFDSVNLKQAAAPQFPYQSFSAKFTLGGMTGKFTDAVKAQLAGTTGAGAASTPAATVAPATSAAAGGASSAAGVTTSVVKSVAPTTTASRAATTSSGSSNGAVSIVVPGVVGSLAGVTIATALAGVMLGMVAFGF
ncbi:hypothetical protein FRC02_010964 [Tulasnella sp. 418]|nr:hypothetical protein FRC02_010964 [Tulasnella sp. 418]